MADKTVLKSALLIIFGYKIDKNLNEIQLAILPPKLTEVYYEILLRIL
jgi:hypothetical protein